MANSTNVNNNENEQGNITTANDLAEMLNGNYRTVRKILERMADNNEIKTTTTKRANRDIIAYYVSNTTTKRVQAELKAIRKGKNSLAHGNNTNANANVQNAQVTSNKSVNAYTVQNNANEVANVKMYEVMKENKMLEYELKEVKDAHKRDKDRVVMLEADLRVAESNLKLIEYKRTAFESENAKLTQEKEKLEKGLYKRNITIAVLSAFILVILTVITTVLLVR